VHIESRAIQVKLFRLPRSQPPPPGASDLGTDGKFLCYSPCDEPVHALPTDRFRVRADGPWELDVGWVGPEFRIEPQKDVQLEVKQVSRALEIVGIGSAAAGGIAMLFGTVNLCFNAIAGSDQLMYGTTAGAIELGVGSALVAGGVVSMYFGSGYHLEIGRGATRIGRQNAEPGASDSP
jgi:hypothetical protein